MVMKLFNAVVLSTTVLVCSFPAVAGDCLKYDDGPQFIDGSISVLKAQDAANRSETALILTPSSPTCLDAKESDFQVGETETIHVFSRNVKLHNSLRSLVGKAIRVSGPPFAAHTAHHHAPIVMDVTKITTD